MKLSQLKPYKVKSVFQARLQASGIGTNNTSMACAKRKSASAVPSIVLALGLSSCLSLYSGIAQAVTYRITFEGIWTAAQVDPGSYPASAHFSPMVGATHQPGLGFWQPGGMASGGMEDVAELGVDTALEAEVNAQIALNEANAYFQVAGSLFSLPNSGFTTITTDSTFSEITLVSMVAPSPDWFVGVYNEPLLDGGTWKPDFSVNLQVWDAGTEEGTGFSLSNAATSPEEPITLLSDSASPFIGQPVVGSLRFELVSDPALADLNERGVQISRVDFETQVVTLKNFGGVEESLNGWRFCTHDEDQVRRYSGSTGLNGITLAPGEELAIHYLNDAASSNARNISSIGGSFATPLDSGAYGMQIYFDPVSFSDGNTIADHLQWSIDGLDEVSADERSDEAETGGVWTDQSLWIATAENSLSIDLDDTSGAALHSPANYTVNNPEDVSVPTLPWLGLALLGSVFAVMFRVFANRTRV